jgi:hypothetical protein
MVPADLLFIQSYPRVERTQTALPSLKYNYPWWLQQSLVKHSIPTKINGCFFQQWHSESSPARQPNCHSRSHTQPFSQSPTPWRRALRGFSPDIRESVGRDSHYPYWVLYADIMQIYVVVDLVSLSANGYSSRIEHVLSRIFREPHIYLLRGSHVKIFR